MTEVLVLYDPQVQVELYSYLTVEKQDANV